MKNSKINYKSAKTSSSQRGSSSQRFLYSLKTYFVLLRFMLLSFLTAIIDYLVFFIAHSYGCGILLSQAWGRGIAITFNYPLVKNAVFEANNANRQAFPKYLTLVVVNGLISYVLIRFFIDRFSWHILLAKMVSELVIYLANFIIQRQLIFNQHKLATDWDSYYQKPYRTASFTRKFTQKNLHAYINEATIVLQKNILASVSAEAQNETYQNNYPKDYINNPAQLAIAELGGANSCFYQGVKQTFAPQKYLIIDNNRLGLEKFKNRIQDQQVILYHQDILQLTATEQVDLVFSVGLIEHFMPQEMEKVIASHFALVKPGGMVIISFPTPTFLYKITRTIAEILRLWIFHDERPLPIVEVTQIVKKHGAILRGKIIWPIFLTQYIMLVRKK